MKDHFTCVDTGDVDAGGVDDGDVVGGRTTMDIL